MAASYVTTLTLLLSSTGLLWQPASCGTEVKCQKTSDPCVFHCPTGPNKLQLLDLSPLKPSNMSVAQFQDVHDSQGQFKYSYSPCSSFHEGSGCLHNTSVCEVDYLDSNKTIEVGTTASVALSVDTSSSTAVLQYTNVVNNIKKTTTVSLVCDKKADKDTLSVTGETPFGSNIYLMKLIGPNACLFESGSSSASPEVTTTSGNITTPGDITTHDYSNVTTPDDITTHGHSNGTTSGEITTQGHSNATTPDDITTHGHSNVTTPGDITTQHSNTTRGEITSQAVTTAADVTTGGLVTGSSTHVPTTPKGTATAFRSDLQILLLMFMGKIAIFA